MAKAGTLNHRIIIQDSTETRDALGEPIKTWFTWATVWAEKRDLTGNALFTAMQVQEKIKTRFKIRWLRGLTAQMRIIWNGGDIYHIDGPPIDPDGRREDMHLMAHWTGERI
jgi:SPP1 family predicted phage head-tail adaptor